MQFENAETLFRVSNTLALVGWALLVFFPRARLTHIAVRTGALSAVFAVGYVILLATGPRFSFGEFQSLAGVSRLFAVPDILLAGWIHYLAFDLWVGVWMVADAEKRSLRHAWIIPPLLLTFLLGPAGFISYLGLRKVLRK